MEPAQAYSVHFPDVDAEKRGICSGQAASLCITKHGARALRCWLRALGPAVCMWDPP